MNDMRRGDPAPVATAMIHAARALDARLEAVLAPLRLSVAKMGVLRHLVQEGAPLALSVLAERNRCVRSNITQLADRLEADGYLRRVPAPGDRRAVLAEPTTAGVLAYQQAADLLAAEEARLTEALPAEVRAQLLELASIFDDS
jgi:DNA-binding MarR family transcriptional regulator